MKYLFSLLNYFELSSLLMVFSQFIATNFLDCCLLSRDNIETLVIARELKELKTVYILIPRLFICDFELCNENFVTLSEIRK